MKQSEINIGDWVQSKSDQSLVQIKTHWDIYNAKDFEPIPITPRILETNGFQNAQFRSTFRINTNHFLEFNSEKELILWEEKSVIRIVVYCVRVDYVHELQHALKLFKIDKEIRI